MICQNCKFWIHWYTEKNGDKVYGCRLGKKPNQAKCDWFQSLEKEQKWQQFLESCVLERFS